MIQIDSEGRFHLVGKNPHLIAVTPERDDNTLRENDIISVGRPDREPWMRFQAIRKPPSNQVVPPANRQRGAGAAPLETANARQSTTSRRISSATKALAPIPSNPPQWITTNTRNHKSSKVPSPPQEGTQPQLPTAQEAASTAMIAGVSGPQVKVGHQVPNPETLVESPRKRLRRGVLAAEVANTVDNDTAPKKSRRINRSGRKTTDAINLDRIMGCNTAATLGDSHKRDHPYVHFFFQDYQTSASLLEGAELRRKSESISSRSASTASKGDSVVRRTEHENDAPPRAVIADASQLRLLSKNFVDALLGGTSSTANEEATTKVQGETNLDTGRKESPQKKAAASAKGCGRGDRMLLSMPSSKELERLPQSMENSGLLESIVGQRKVNDCDKLVCEAKTASMLSLQGFDSFSLVPGQTKYMPGVGGAIEPTDVGAKKSDADDELHGQEDSPSSSCPSCDPVLDLKPWQDMMKQEEASGNRSSFRYALASLIVAKNQDRLNEEERRGLSWLPSLLAEDFKVEQPGEEG